MPKLYVEKMSPEASLPEKSYDTDSGWDIRYTGEERIIVRAKQREIIPTKLRMTTDPGYFIKIESRSGLAFKNGISLLCGVGDNGYRDEYFICVQNNDMKNPLAINSGDRIAQILVLPKIEAELVEVEKLPDVEIQRSGGLGHTGV